MAILSPLFYWPEYGSMFTAPAIEASADTKAEYAASEASTTDPTPSAGANVVPKVRCELCFQRAHASLLP